MTDEKTVCVIYYTDIRFKNMALSAAKSFKKHHPDVDMFLYDSHSYMTAFGGIFPGRVISDYPPGVAKFVLAQWTVVCGDYKKVIVLGADTITCARLDEFLDDDESDVIATLDFNYPLRIPGVRQTDKEFSPPSFMSPIVLKNKENDTKNIININPILEDITDTSGAATKRSDKITDIYLNIFSNTNLYEFQFIHLNADVVCFNNVEFLKYVIDFTTQNIQAQQRYENNVPPGFVNQYYEQGSLNFCTFAGWSGKSDDIETIGKEKLCFASKDMKRPKVFIPELYDENIIYNIRSQQSQKNVWKEYQDRNLHYDFTFPLGAKKDIDFIKQYYVDDNKLYTSEGKQIKVWHYCDDFGGQTLKYFAELERKWINTFNEETKNFFSNNCDCGDYFK